MAYVAPTADDFLARFPAFQDVPPDILAAFLVEALAAVGDTWGEGDYRMGVMLYMAHSLVLDGQGSGAEVELAQAGALGFQSMTSGALSLTRGDRMVSGSDPLTWTTYGQRYLALLRRNFPAVLVV